VKRQLRAQAWASGLQVHSVPRQRLMQTSVWLVAIAASLGVFALYVQPDFLVVLADQVWACF
jgi:hypothetical protein